jgi:hypothetical protein
MCMGTFLVKSSIYFKAELNWIIVQYWLIFVT